MPTRVISAYVTQRNEFRITNGYQPTNSLFYLLEGSFSCAWDEKEELVKAGDVALFDTETPMRRCVLEPVRFLYIKYDIPNQALFPHRHGVFHGISGRGREDLDRILEASERPSPLALRLQSHYFNDLLLCLPRQGEDAGEATGMSLPSAADRPIAFLREHLAEKISLEDVARAMGVSVSSLEGRFRETTGVSVYEYLISLRMEHATRLLTETAYTVTEIAARCGYDNLFYFCNAFKKRQGMTPGEYRRVNTL